MLLAEHNLKKGNTKQLPAAEYILVSPETLDILGVNFLYIRI